jgi:O-antigen ligase
MSAGVIARIKRWEWRILILLIYFLPLKEAPKNVIWGVLIFLFLARMFSSSLYPATGKMGFMTGAWLAAGMVSSFLAIEPYASWKGLWDVVRGISFLWIVASHVREDNQLVKLVRHIIFSVVIASIVGLGNCAWALLVEKKYAADVRVGLPSVGHPNQSGIYLAICWLLAIVAALREDVLRSWKIALICLVIIGVALFGSMARVALVVAAFTTVFLVFQNRRTAPRWILHLMVAGVGFGLLAALASHSIRSKLMFRGSFSNRTGIWNNVLETIWNRPWTGVGLNNFKNVVLAGGNKDGIHLTTDHAHNVYFNTLLQTGWVGFFIFLLLIAVAGAGVLKLYFSMEPNRRWASYVVGSAWMVIVGVGFSATTLHHEMAILFFILMGAMAGLQRSVGATDDREVRKTAATTQAAPTR